MRQHAWTLILATAWCAGLVVANVMIASRPLATDPILKPAAATDGLGPASAASQFHMPALAMEQATARPVFLESRRPWAVPVVEQIKPPEPVIDQVSEVAAPPPTPLDVKLVGIEDGPSTLRALLLKPNTAEPVWITPGEVLDGWTIDGIEKDAIVVVSNGTKQRLELYDPIVVQQP